MLFSSTVFICCFLPVVILLYYVAPGIQMKNVILLLASLFFYAWGEPKYLVLMIASITCNYIGGRLLDLTKKQKTISQITLAIFILANIGLLFYFKYFNFFTEIISGVTGKDWIVNIALPVGISFYTFQGMSYVIDVYRNDIAVQKNPIKLALYISMFPQLIAGPIVRYKDIVTYLDNRKIGVNKFAEGIDCFICGLAKKVIFANVLGNVATQIMETNVPMISTTEAWIGAFCYMLQIYYDFSGYSDMAIGLGKMFGFEFMQNFNYPYISKSISEFWRRWHISLSQWFRDYLYIPLGGSRKGNVYVNLFIVFLVTGVWHGAAWGFVIWGLWHGFFVIIEKFIKKNPIIKYVPEIVKWIYTMSVVFFGWILFRIVDISDTIRYFSIMFGKVQNEFISYELGWYMDNRTVFILVIAVLCCIPWSNIVNEKILFMKKIMESDIIFLTKKIIRLIILVICFLFITNSSYNPFIYFRF